MRSTYRVRVEELERRDLPAASVSLPQPAFDNASTHAHEHAANFLNAPSGANQPVVTLPAQGAAHATPDDHSAVA
jgi:hypothetical protein